jgi:LemA protein
MVTLNKKESKRFLKRMIAKEKAPITKKEKKMAEEIKQNSKYFKVTNMKGGKEDMERKGNAFAIVLIVLGIMLFAGLVMFLWVMGSYNGLVSQDTKTQQLWGNIESAYQRRMDLIPNLVATVQGSASFEKGTLIGVTEARTKYLAATTVADKQAAANQFDSALSRLLVTVEAYPDLKTTAAFMALQDELAGTENRIKWERDQYNSGARDYQLKVRRFPTNIIAGMFGFELNKWQTFKANDAASVAPVVNFTG